jgi:alkylation response protein AidB-like acyl-CoA dehydrogenase
VLAELATELDIARTYLDDCLAEHLTGSLTAARAAKLKWWTTDLQVRTADHCLQLHGGYGYMREYSVSRAFVDARIQTIYGGTNEIMKTIIAKDLGLRWLSTTARCPSRRPCARPGPARGAGSCSTPR